MSDNYKLNIINMPGIIIDRVLFKNNAISLDEYIEEIKNVMSVNSLLKNVCNIIRNDWVKLTPIAKGKITHIKESYPCNHLKKIPNINNEEINSSKIQWDISDQKYISDRQKATKTLNNLNVDLEGGRFINNVIPYNYLDKIINVYSEEVTKILKNAIQLDYALIDIVDSTLRKDLIPFVFARAWKRRGYFDSLSEILINAAGKSESLKFIPILDNAKSNMDSLYNRITELHPAEEHNRYVRENSVSKGKNSYPPPNNEKPSWIKKIWDNVIEKLIVKIIVSILFFLLFILLAIYTTKC